MSDVPLRKRLAGSDSYGHEWAEDGAVVNVSYDVAMELLAIPDAGFSVADTPEDLAAADEAKDPDPEVTEPDPAEPMDEVAPDPEAPATDAPAKKTAARRSTKA
jgi:hypothetical protein